MATYLIGDVQGCFDDLQLLLQKINYDPNRDRLGFVGDIVNRGPKSLETLRFIKNQNNALLVLGNHDLHLLAIGYGVVPPGKHDTLQSILSASDKMELLEWLRQQPLAYFDKHLNFLLVHAGFPPQWDIAQTLKYAAEVHKVLSGNYFLEFLQRMHGNEPSAWQEDLQGYDRLRYIVNALTRLRFCDKNGKLDLKNKTNQSTDPNFKPWFAWKNAEADIIFGHWASLEGKTNKPNYYALDTGCVWGNCLTALDIENKLLFSISN